MNNPLKEKKEKKEIIAQHLEVEVDEISDFLLDVVWEYIVNYIGYDPMLQKRIAVSYTHLTLPTILRV